MSTIQRCPSAQVRGGLKGEHKKKKEYKRKDYARYVGQRRMSGDGGCISAKTRGIKIYMVLLECKGSK
jgi:hypothetical protein